MIRRQADVFIEIEGRHMAEIQLLIAVHVNQVRVHELGRGAGREAKNGVWFFSDLTRHNARRKAGDFDRAALYDYFHEICKN